MTSRTTIARLAKSIGHELRSGMDPSEGVHLAGPMLAQQGAAPEIVAGLFAETRRKRSDETTIGGFAFLLEKALDTLRLDMNGGDTSAGPAIEEVRHAAAAAFEAAPAEPAAMLLVARAFGRAGLDPGPELQALMAEAMEGQSAGSDMLGMEDTASQLEGLAAQFGHDPFTIYTELSASGGAFPVEHRLAMAVALAGSATASVREAALGFVLGGEPPIAEAVLRALARPPQGHPVSSAMVQRLVLIRPWLPGSRREAVDAAIRAMRPGATAPKAAAKPEIVRVLASLCDGVGAQSLFALTRHGRQFAMASILLKTEEGVADAWVGDPMSKREADRMIREIVSMAEGVDIAPGLLMQRLTDSLAVNLARDCPPPFGLVQVIEWLGLGPLHPQAIEPAELARTLLADLPEEQSGAAAEQAAHEASARWEERFATTASWFEAGQAVETLLRPLKTRKQRTEAVLRQVLPARRLYWAGLCAWTAATLKSAAKPGDAAWREFALVARALASDRPLAQMPLAGRIAAVSADAFMLR